MARRAALDSRDRILDTASRLFDTHGVHSVGLQQIIDELGCGKNLLYREFANKDDLVVAYLRRCGADWDSILEQAAEAEPDDPGGQLVAVVRAAADRAVMPGFRGCPIHNTQAEFPHPEHPAHKAALEHIGAVPAQLLDLAKRTGVADPQRLADRIILIVDGLNANGAALGSRGAVGAAVSFAEDVVAAELRR